MIEFLKKLKKKKQCDERAENTHHALFWLMFAFFFKISMI